MGQPAFLPPSPISGNKYKMKMNDSLEKKDAPVKQLEDMEKQLRGLGYPDQALAGNEKLQKLARAYNLVVEEISRLEEKSRFDPVERLPNEVWLAVLKEAIVKESHGSSFISIEMVLLLTLVSSKWRRFIESTPTLWSDIVLDDEREDLAMKVAISLLFSRNAYLTVQVVGCPRRWSEIGSIVLPHAGRIRSLYLVGIRTDNPFDSLFHFAIKQLMTPQLRSIDWTDSSHDMLNGDKIFLSGQSEHLQRAIGITLTRDVFDLLSIRTIEEFATYEDPKCVLAQTLPHLEKMAFLARYPVDEKSIGGPLAIGTLSWTSLTYHQPDIETLTSLLSRLPLLRDLSIMITYDDLSQVISSMRNLKALRSLELTLWNIPNNTFVPPITIEPLHRVRKFIFKERNGGLSDSACGKLSQLPNAFFSLMPNVNFLEIQSYFNSMVSKLISAIGFRNLDTLLLDSTSAGYPQVDSPFSESIKNLRIRSNLPHRAVAPGVERLQLGFLDLHSAGSQYSTVQSLDFAYFLGPSNNFQPFATVADIFIGGAKAVIRFCLIIAASPDTCPALHTLSFGQFPDLDILFIMLERRNLYSHSTRARIRKLGLPTRMSLSNFKIVRELLRGRIVERQSNFEASLQSNIDMFLDRDM
jgi:F-box-like